MLTEIGKVPTKTIRLGILHELNEESRFFLPILLIPTENTLSSLMLVKPLLITLSKQTVR